MEVVQREQYKHLKNMLVEVYEFKKDVLPTKVSTFLWNNPEVQVKFNERAGTLKVFYKGKKCSTAYVKVYSKGKDGDSFYRDGYLDISGSFRYAMSEASKVKEFAILVLTDFGGIISKVKPPSH